MCGGGQLLVSGSYFQGPGCQDPMSQGHKTQVPGFQFQGLRVPSPRVPGSWVPGSWILGPGYRVPESWVLGPRSQVLIVDYALHFTSLLLFLYFIFLKSDIMNFRRFPLAIIFFFFLWFLVTSGLNTALLNVFRGFNEIWANFIQRPIQNPVKHLGWSILRK